MKKIWKRARKKLHDFLARKFGFKRAYREKKITELQQRGDLQRAAELAVRYIALYPDSWLFHFVVGSALHARAPEQETEICQHLGAVLALRPGHLETCAHLLSIILRSKDLPALALEFSDTLSKACAATDDRRLLNLLLRAIVLPEDLDQAADQLARIYRNAGHEPDLAIGPIRTVRDWAATSHAPLMEAGDVESIPFKPPVVYGAPASLDIIYGRSNKPYVAELANVRVFSHSSVIQTAEGVMLSDDAGHETFGEFVSFKYERRLALRQRDRLLLDLTQHTARKMDAAIFLGGLASESFGHWFPEFLPRVQFLRRHPDFDKLPIILDADMPASHYQYLRGLVKNEFILMEADETLSCGRLLLASSPTFLPVHLTVSNLNPHDVPGMSPRSLQFLKDELSPAGTARPHRRIFLARKNMQWRRLTNEGDVAEALVKLGFEIVHLETMSAAAQIEVFQQAAWIVAPNGSALLNIIFADTAVKILVISQPNLFNWGAFQGPFEVLGYRPVFVCGEYAADTSKKHSDYSVPPGLVVKALADMGLPVPDGAVRAPA